MFNLRLDYELQSIKFELHTVIIKPYTVIIINHGIQSVWQINNLLIYISLIENYHNPLPIHIHYDDSDVTLV